MSAFAPLLAVLLTLVLLIGTPALIGQRIQRSRHRASLAAVEAYHSVEHEAPEPGYLTEDEATLAVVTAAEGSAFAEGTRRLVAAVEFRERVTRDALEAVLERALAELGLTKTEKAFVRMATGEFPAVRLA